MIEFWHNGGVVRVRNIGGVLRCSCLDFIRRNKCQHVDDCVNEPYYVEEEPDVKIPDKKKLMEEQMAYTSARLARWK